MVGSVGSSDTMGTVYGDPPPTGVMAGGRSITENPTGEGVEKIVNTACDLLHDSSLPGEAKQEPFSACMDPDVSSREQDVTTRFFHPDSNSFDISLKAVENRPQNFLQSIVRAIVDLFLKLFNSERLPENQMHAAFSKILPQETLNLSNLMDLRVNLREEILKCVEGKMSTNPPPTEELIEACQFFRQQFVKFGDGLPPNHQPFAGALTGVISSLEAALSDLRYIQSIPTINQTADPFEILQGIFTEKDNERERTEVLSTISSAVADDLEKFGPSLTIENFIDGNLQCMVDNEAKRDQLRSLLDDSFYSKENFREIRTVGSDSRIFEAVFSNGTEEKTLEFSNRVGTIGEFRGEVLKGALQERSYKNLREFVSFGHLTEIDSLLRYTVTPCKSELGLVDSEKLIKLQAVLAEIKVGNTTLDKFWIKPDERQ
jgi:hypothetical protein